MLACPDFPDQIRHVQTLATKTWHFQTFATMMTMIRRGFRDRSGGARPKHRDSFGMFCHISTFATEKVRHDFCDRGGYGATLRLRKRRDRRDQTQQFPGLSRPRWRQRNFPDQYGDGAPLKISGLSRPKLRRRDFPDQHGDSAAFENFFRALATEVDMARFSRLRWIRRDSQNARLSGATHKTREMARLSGPKRRRQDLSDQGGREGATFQNIAETV